MRGVVGTKVGLQTLTLTLALTLSLSLSLSLTRALTLTKVGLEIRRKGAAADAKETLVITRDKVRYRGDIGEIQGRYRGGARHHEGQGEDLVGVSVSVRFSLGLILTLTGRREGAAAPR